MDLRLENKRVDRTGASEGNGRAVVEYLAAEGCDVAFCARRQELLDEVADSVRAATGRRLFPVSTDLMERDAIDAFVERAAQELGGIDIVINNAGASIFAQLFEVPDERWLQDIELKFMSYVRTSRAAIGTCALPGAAGSSTSPATAGERLHCGRGVNAAIEFTVSLANYLAPTGSRDTCARGVRTARLVSRSPRTPSCGESRSMRPNSGSPRIAARVHPSAEDVAGVIAFSLRARRYMTGTTVTVDGGITRGI